MNEFLINWAYSMILVVGFIIIITPMVWFLLKDWFVVACVYIFIVVTVLSALGATFG